MSIFVTYVLPCIIRFLLYSVSPLKEKPSHTIKQNKGFVRTFNSKHDNRIHKKQISLIVHKVNALTPCEGAQATQTASLPLPCPLHHTYSKSHLKKYIHPFIKNFRK